MILGREWADGDFYLFGGDDSSLLRAFSYCFVAAFCASERLMKIIQDTKKKSINFAKQ